VFIRLFVEYILAVLVKPLPLPPVVSLVAGASPVIELAEDREEEITLPVTVGYVDQHLDSSVFGEFVI